MILFGSCSQNLEALGKFRCSKFLKQVNLHILLCLVVYIPKASSVWHPDIRCDVVSDFSLPILHDLSVAGLIMFIVALVHNPLSCVASINRSLSYLIAPFRIHSIDPSLSTISLSNAVLMKRALYYYPSPLQKLCEHDSYIHF